MRNSVRIVAAAAGAVVGGLAGAGALGAWVWDRATSRMVARLGADGDRKTFGSYRPEAIGALPAPVRRYFEFALTPGQPLIRIARVEHTGEFRTGPDAAWSAFRSTQVFSADPPGFAWDARIDMLPLVSVRVRDSYIGGSAVMLGKVAALIPVVDQKGGPELAFGALHRYLAEAAWLPTALLPRENLHWEHLGDTAARVTLEDSGATVSMDVHFGSSGEIVHVEAERYRDVDGVGVPTPFVASFDDYADVVGMRIPMTGKATWILPDDPFTYWKGRIDRIEYDFAR